MDKKTRTRNYLSVLTGILLCGPAMLPLSAQEIPPSEVMDTSYFKAGDDDWNLVESVLRGNPDALFLLLQRGADPNAKAEGGMTALMFAVERGDLRLVKLLVLNGADLELTYLEKTTPLLIAVLNNHFEVAQFLLEKGADPDHKDQFDGSALLYAAALNNYQIADLLLFFGASDSIRDGDGNTALMTAVYFGNLETSDVLLQDGLDPDGEDNQQNTPLMIAAQQGDLDITRLLLEYKAGLERVNKLNLTPLGHAILFRQDSVAILLVDSGANVNHLVRTGQNLYDLARQQSQASLLRVMKDAGAKTSPGPGFSEYNLGWGNSFRGNEHLMQVRFGITDQKFGFFAETGIDFRLLYRKVQFEMDDELIRQYREFRWVWTHGGGKNFSLFHDRSGMDYGAYGALYGMLSVPYHRGTSQDQNITYSLALSGGMYMKGDIAGLKAGAERYTFGTLNEGAWKINITLFVRIQTRKFKYVGKEIIY